jgi:para-aminobenzoate synthetase component I
LLDSGQVHDAATGKAGGKYGRYDILVAEPFITFVTVGNLTTITQNGLVQTSSEDPFLLLKNCLNNYQTENSISDLPFAGGALGYFGYDLGRRLEALPNIALTGNALPEMMLGIYDWAIVVDHREKTCQLVSHGLTQQVRDNWPSLVARFNAPYQAAASNAGANQADYFHVTTAIQSNLPEPQYKQAFNKIKAYITAGDCYQVNLAQRFAAKVTGNSWLAYKKLREISPAPFMAYMNLPLADNVAHKQFQVLSNSPERFLQTDGNHVETRPIKGTRPRSSNAAEDLAYSNELLTSLKDKAENVMIVDLLRNDLGKSCEIGSVKVNALFQLQSFTNVHHMVSIVVGKLKANAHVVDFLKGCFPGGSITGAPKLRSMQIIEELEPHRRGIYCGAIGYIGFDSKMDTNIAIRTAVVANNELSFYAGGGIVSDSELDKEYAETLDKASSMIKIMQFFTRL